MNIFVRCTCRCVVLSIFFSLSALSETSINASNRHAYGANIGWINARGDVTNGAVLKQLYCTGYLWSANCGWIVLGSGPTNGFEYSNMSAEDFGVNIQGSQLRGFAYGANIGWINFETNGNPRVDLLTGNLSGSAWGANIGWIGLSNIQAFAQTDSLSPGPDTDGDGIPDDWEFSISGNLTTYGAHPNDEDLDGFSDVEEYLADTNPGDENSYLHITELSRLTSTSKVTWTVSPARLYRLEQTMAATNNSEWVDSGLGIIPPGVDPTLTRSMNDPAATTQYFRAKALLPLQP